MRTRYWALQFLSVGVACDIRPWDPGHSPITWYTECVADGATVHNLSVTIFLFSAVPLILVLRRLVRARLITLGLPHLGL